MDFTTDELIGALEHLQSRGVLECAACRDPNSKIEFRQDVVMLNVGESVEPCFAAACRGCGYVMLFRAATIVKSSR